jgi:predicted molibdopterin-dependent oxidoreductase YjgC
VDVVSGAIKTLLVVGEDGVLGSHGESLPLGKLDALIVLASHTGALADAAQVALPMAAWAEKDGTFTNQQRLVQRIRAAVAAPGDALPAWDVLGRLGRKLGMTIDLTSAKQVFGEAREKLPHMKGAEWGRMHRPVQLRFLDSRG